jgi:hypothetical protein
VVELAKLPLTDETVGLMAQHCTNIQSLDLSACDELTNEIRVLSALKNLRLIVIRDNPNLTDVSFLSHCTKLEHLDLGSCYSLSDDSFKGLSDNLKKLRDLQLDYLAFITDKLLTPFFKHCRLRTVSSPLMLSIVLTRVIHRSVCEAVSRSRTCHCASCSSASNTSSSFVCATARVSRSVSCASS